jgi:peroxiredoxin Q/BCP
VSLGVGDRPPTSRCPAPAGATTRSPSSAGKPVVLVFYPGDDTPVCTKQLNSYNDDLEQFSELTPR